MPHTFDLLTETTQVGAHIAAVLLLLFRLVRNFKCLADAVKLARRVQGCQLEGLMQASAAHSGVSAGIEDLIPSVGDIHVSIHVVCAATQRREHCDGRHRCSSVIIMACADN